MAKSKIKGYIVVGADAVPKEFKITTYEIEDLQKALWYSKVGVTLFLTVGRAQKAIKLTEDGATKAGMTNPGPWFGHKIFKLLEEPKK